MKSTITLLLFGLLPLARLAAESTGTLTGELPSHIHPVSATTEAETQRVQELFADAGSDPIVKLEAFVAANPESPWTLSIHANLGDMYRSRGRNTLALAHWQTTWDELKASREKLVQDLANHVLAMQLELLCSLGRLETLHQLLKEAETRTISDYNDRRRIETAKEAYLIMVDHPTISYRCGSLALANIARQQKKPASVINTLVEEPSTSNGISLRRLVELSQQLQLGLVAVKRSDHTTLPVPSVIHWAQNHYGAILDYRSDINSYYVVDPTFLQPKWVTARDLDEEASGYFLVPKERRLPEWGIVPDEICANIFGRGYPYNINDGKDKGCRKDPTNPNAKCSTCQGMPVWWVSEPYINLWLADEPWSYTTTRGEEMGFRVTVKQRDSMTNNFSYPKPGFQHNWYSKIYITGQSSSYPISSGFSDWNATLYLTTGGEQNYSKSLMSEEDSKTQLQFSYGTLSDGTVYMVPGFPLGTGTIAPPMTNWYDDLSGFRVFYPDGSVDRYGLIYWRTNLAQGIYDAEALLTSRADPLGNVTTLTYQTYSNTLFRLSSVTDYDGNSTTFSYYTSNAGLLQQVTSPYGQTATFYYDSNGNLTNIVDAVQLSSKLAWDSQGRVSTLITPYGTNGFNYYEAPLDGEGNLGGLNRVNRSITATNAAGGTSLYLYRFDSSSFMPTQFSTNDIPIGTPYNTLDIGTTNASTNFMAVSYRNSFYWDPRQYNALSTTIVTNLTSSDYIKARMQHWLGDSNNVTVLDLLSVEREPSADGVTEGQKTFYDYPGKTANYLQGTNSQTAVSARVQPSGNSEYEWSQFNSAGYPSKEISTYTLGDGTIGTRTNTYIYSTNVITISNYVYCPFCNANATNEPGCPEPPCTTQVQVYLQGAYKLKTNNMSAVSWPNLLTYATNADTSYRTYSGYIQQSAVATPPCGITESITKQYTIPLPTTFVNEAGYSESFAYDANNRLLTHVSSSGLTTVNKYDANGFLTNSVNIETSATNNFTYTNGLIATYQDPLGLITTNQWDSLQRLVSRSDPEGFVWNVYTRLDLTATEDKRGNWSYFGYDSLRRPIAFTNANQEISQAKYCQCGALDWVLDRMQKYTYFYYDSAGRLTNVSYPDGYSVTKTLNAIDQVVQISDALGSTTNTYNIQGLLTLAQNAAGTIHSTVYNSMDRPISIVDATGVTNAISYDVLARVVTNSVGGSVTNVIAYNARGLVKVTDGLGNFTLYSNNVAGWLRFQTNANNEVIQFKYDPAGNVTNVSDGKQQQTSFQLDRFGRLTNKLDNTSAAVLRLTYNVNGQIKTRWTPARNGTTTYVYDAVGQVRTNSYPFDQQVVFTYDPNGRLTNMSDSIGSSLFTYSAAGQLTSAGGLWPDDMVSFGYNNRLRQSMSILAANASPWLVSYQYDGARRLNSITSSAGSFAYQFYPGIGGSFSSPLWQKITLPNGAYLSRSFDLAGRVLTNSLLNASVAVLDTHSYAFDPAGRRTNHMRFDNSFISYGYDKAGQLKSAIGTTQAGGVRALEQFGYNYDAAGNLVNRTNNDLVITLTPNGLNELSSVSRNNTATIAGDTTVTPTSVAVQDNGNPFQTATVYGDTTFARSNVTLLSGMNTFAAGALDSYGRTDTNTLTVSLPTSASFLYDPNGNLTNDGVRNFAYDDEDRVTTNWVTASWKSEFVYDGLGRRRIERDYAWISGAWRETNEVRFVYDGWLIVQERDGNNLPKVSYTRGLDLSGTFQGAGGIGGLLARSDQSTPTPTHAFYSADALGNVTALMNSQQAIAARYLYDPFGNTLSLSGPLADANLYRFSSQEFHQNSGLLLFTRRVYAPNLQRWLNRDPIGESGGINLYAFVGNRSPNEVDPIGLLGTPGEDAALVAALGAEDAADILVGPQAVRTAVQTAFQTGATVADDAAALALRSKLIAGAVASGLAVTLPNGDLYSPPDPNYGYILGEDEFRDSEGNIRNLSTGEIVRDKFGRPRPSTKPRANVKCDEAAKRRLFRGGNSLEARLGADVRQATDGLIHPLGKNGKPQGLSLNDDPQDPNVQKYGGAFPVESLPEGLQILPSGRPGHFVIAPATPMSFEQFQQLLGQVQLGTSNKIP